MSERWIATGWRGRTVLVYSLNLPGGLRGEIRRRSINQPWTFATADDLWRSNGRRYRYRNNAIAACEETIRQEARAVLRLLRTKPETKWP